jgi:hypothetical protein
MLGGPYTLSFRGGETWLAQLSTYRENSLKAGLIGLPFSFGPERLSCGVNLLLLCQHLCKSACVVRGLEYVEETVVMGI